MLSVDPSSLIFLGYVPYPNANKETQLYKLLLCLFSSFLSFSLLTKYKISTICMLFCKIPMFLHSSTHLQAHLVVHVINWSFSLMTSFMSYMQWEMLVRASRIRLGKTHFSLGDILIGDPMGSQKTPEG